MADKPFVDPNRPILEHFERIGVRNLDEGRITVIAAVWEKP